MLLYSAPCSSLTTKTITQNSFSSLSLSAALLLTSSSQTCMALPEHISFSTLCEPCRFELLPLYCLAQCRIISWGLWEFHAENNQQGPLILNLLWAVGCHSHYNKSANKSVGGSYILASECIQPTAKIALKPNKLSHCFPMALDLFVALLLDKHRIRHQGWLPRFWK